MTGINSIAQERLKDSIRCARVGHAYLIVGSDEAANAALALDCAALMITGSEDVAALRLSPDFYELDGSASVDEIRELRAELQKRTYMGGRRTIVINRAHLLNDSAVNAMLKMLEEPPSETCFILTGLEHRLLPTVRSRCFIIRLGAEPDSDIQNELKRHGASAADAKLYCALSIGQSSRALRLYSDAKFRLLRDGALDAFTQTLGGKADFKWAKAIGKDRDAARECIEFMLAACHDMLLIKCGIEAQVNIDRRAALEKLSQGFTAFKISCIIDIIVDAARRLGTNAGPTMIFDRMFVEILEER